MPVTTNSELMSIALNQNMRIHERIEAIKKSDGINGISSIDEANAILSIPNNHILITDNSERLMIEKLCAKSFLKDGGRSLRDDLSDLYRYCINKGEMLATRFMNWITPNKPLIVKK